MCKGCLLPAVAHCFATILLFTKPVLAQKETIAFGDVSMNEMLMKKFDGDTSAFAVMLFDKGVVRLDGNSMVGTTYRKSMRIKILDQRATGWADFEFEVPDEAVLKVDASTFNLENGRMVESKLNNSAIYRTRHDKYTQKVNFALPNVRAGSVLEVSWSLQLRDFYLPSWQFQHKIPTVRSDYVIYGLFKLKPHLTGDIKPQHHESKYNNTYNEWVMTDIPAFKDEPLMPDRTVYLSMVKFVGDDNWEYVVQWMLARRSFYGAIEGNGFIRDKVLEITKGLEGEQIVEAISNYIKANVAWNNINDYLADDFELVLRQRRGSAGDINLLLACMLTKAGLKVAPVLISTRDHGFIEQELPSRHQFNYVVCQVTLDDRELLVDATEKGLPYDALPARCFNHKGFMVSRSHYGWIGIEPHKRSKVSLTGDFTVDESGKLAGKIVLAQDDYAAYAERSSQQPKDIPIDVFADKAGNLKLISKENADVLTKPFTRRYELQSTDYADVAGNHIYMSPYPFLRMAENSFKETERNYPIDFGMISEQVCVFRFVVPEGYAVKEMPKSESFGLPVNAARFALNVTSRQREISVVSRIQINKTLFMPDEYSALREFYARIVARMASLIVIEKTRTSRPAATQGENGNSCYFCTENSNYATGERTRGVLAGGRAANAHSTHVGNIAFCTIDSDPGLV